MNKHLDITQNTAVPESALERKTLKDHGMLLHPLYIMRVAGEPAGLLDQIETGETGKLVEEAHQLRKALEAIKQDMCTHVETLVPDLDDKAECRTALKMKRAHFNLKPVAAGSFAFLEPLLSADVYKQLVDFNSDLQWLRDLDQAILDGYDAEVAHGETALLGLLDRPNLMAGIAYTGPQLYEQLRYRFAPDSERRLKAKIRRGLEESITQYAARASTKTSPMSTFTVMNVAPWNTSDREPRLQLEYEGTLERRLSVKGALMLYVFQGLTQHFELAAQIFPLSINSSAVTGEGKIKFRTLSSGSLASGRFWGTGEAFSEMPESGLTKLLAHIFQAQGPMMAPDLVAAMQAAAPKLTPEAIWPALNKLYAAQFLRPETGEYEQSEPLDWANRMMARAKQALGAESAQVIAGHLADIREALDAFADGNNDVRFETVGRINTSIDALAKAFRAEPHKMIFRPNFFENCYLAPPAEAMTAASLDQFGREIALLTNISPILGFAAAAKSRFADYFLHRFGPEGRCEDVIGFLDDFDEIYGLGVISHILDPEKLAPETPATAALRTARVAVEDLIEPHLRSDADSISLNVEDLEAALSLIPEEIRSRSNSQSYLGQITGTGDDAIFVLNQIFGGRSSVMSRFLEVCDEDETEAVRAYLSAGAGDQKTAELSGVFGFNANLHPHTTDTELRIPPYPPGRDTSAAHSLKDLTLVYDKSTHHVHFETAEGEQLNVFYHGLLIPNLLPRLHRVLAYLFNEGPYTFAFNTMVERNIVSPRQVSRVPRIMLGNVMIQRQMWIFPPDDLPDPETAPRDYYLAMQKWRRECDLPSKIFARVLPFPGAMEEGDDPIASIDWSTLDFKDMKPFFVDFDSPRGVRLMQRMIKRNRFSVCFTEVAPRLDQQHVNVDGQPHVAEIQFETTKPPTPHNRTPHWMTLRIAYFDEKRHALIKGPVKEAVDLLNTRFGIGDVTVQTQWKFGPHVEISFKADPLSIHGEIVPALKGIFTPWLAQNPSTRQIDPAAYQALSAKLGVSELEPGPYSPLLKDNSVTLVPHTAKAALKLPELSDSKQSFLSAATPLLFDLIKLKEQDNDDFLLTLIAMMARAGETYQDMGLERGFMSYRSHAEYFFAAYDTKGEFRPKFDAFDARFGPKVDEIIRATHAGKVPDINPLASSILRVWTTVVQAAADENIRISTAFADVLRADTTFDDLVSKVTPGADENWLQQTQSREVSAVGQAFEQDEGVALRQTPEFMAYRTTVNFFYLLLPVLEVSPTQKFCLCHLLANGSERVFDIRWQQIMGLEPMRGAE